MDITLQSTEDQDGGILIRGLKKKDGAYINGPRKVIFALFEAFGPIEDKNSIRLVNQPSTLAGPIIKTFRHGLTKKTSPRYYDKPYRYGVDFEHWDILKKDITTIKKDCTELK